MMRRLATMAAASHALRLGPVALRPAQVALETPLSVVVRDLRPVLPGHVVVAPKRRLRRPHCSYHTHPLQVLVH